MAKLSHLWLLFFSLSVAGTATCAATATSAASNFIQVSCRSTSFPALCVQSLSAYATVIQQSPRQLAQTSLSVSLDRAQSATSFVSKFKHFKGLKGREYKAIRDCVEEMSDTVDRLSQSFQELKQTGKSKGQDFQWHMSNVQTWVSAAITDENTCVDGFSGRALDGKVKASIKARIVNVAQVTSNALALVNRYASKN